MILSSKQNHLINISFLLGVWYPYSLKK